MRLLLTFMAMAVLVVSIGCDKKDAEEAAKTTGNSAGGAGEVAAKDGSASTKTSETQTVSLKLPGMT
jgi:hypothetical protein